MRIGHGKKLTFYYCFHNYSLCEAGAAGCTNIIDPDIIDVDSVGYARSTCWL